MTCPASRDPTGGASKDQSWRPPCGGRSRQGKEFVAADLPCGDGHMRKRTNRAGVRSSSNEDRLIGHRIRLAWHAAGLSQTELGDAIRPRLSYQQIRKYELGLSRLPWATAIQLTGLLGISPNELLGVKTVVKQAIDPHAYALAIELGKLSAPVRRGVIRFVRSLIQGGHGVSTND